MYKKLIQNNADNRIKPAFPNVSKGYEGISEIKTVLAGNGLVIGDVDNFVDKLSKPDEFQKVFQELVIKTSYSYASLTMLFLSEGIDSLQSIEQKLSLFHLASVSAQLAVAKSPQADPLDAIFQGLLSLNGRAPNYKRFDGRVTTMTGLFENISRSIDNEGKVTIANCKPLSILRNLVLRELDFDSELMVGVNRKYEAHAYTVDKKRITENTIIENNGRWRDEEMIYERAVDFSNDSDIYLEQIYELKKIVIQDKPIIRKDKILYFISLQKKFPGSIVLMLQIGLDCHIFAKNYMANDPVKKKYIWDIALRNLMTYQSLTSDHTQDAKIAEICEYLAENL